tara:strand:+ start:14200 stop:15834 length:1635 start_codon:yes stop_codon:yes gene_type:complete
MSNVVNQLLETANPYTSVAKDAARLAGKWEKSGLLEGISHDGDKGNMAILLENQAKQLVVEASSTGTGGTFTAGTGEQYAAVALPLVRKVFGQIAAKEFVSVQPMSLPAGLVFYLDFQYGTTKKPFVDGESMYGKTSSNFGNEASGGLYGAGRFGYSVNEFSSSINSVTVYSSSWDEVNFDSDLSASVARNEIKHVRLTTASISTNLDLEAVRSFVVTSGSILESRQLPAFTKQVAGSTDVRFYFTGSAAEIKDGNTYVVHFSKTTADNARGDFEDGADYSSQSGTGRAINIPEINVQLRSETIAAKTRKLKAQWTPEFSQDLNAFHSLDAEAELTNILSEYISLEIDLEILDMLIDSVPASNVANWSAKVGQEINTAGTAYESNTDGVYYTQMSWFQTLGIKLQKISNIIHQKTLRGGANFMVVSPTVATILESIPGFAADSDGDAAKATYAFGVQKIGALNSRYKVYKNPYMTENTILLGFRGNQFLESGAVYAPYIPLIMTPLVYDPNTFTPRKGIMTRYAKKMVRPEFYGKVHVSGLNVI